MNSFDRDRNDVDLDHGTFRDIDDDCDISSMKSPSDVYEGFRKDSIDSKRAPSAGYVSQRCYDWRKMDRRQQEGEMIRRSSGERDKVECYEQEPSELLRKLDELKDQIIRSCQVNEKPSYRSQIPPEPATSSSSSYMHRREMDMLRSYPPTQQFPPHDQRFEIPYSSGGLGGYPSSSSTNVPSQPFQARWKGNLSSESVEFSGNGHKIPNGKLCHPIAGGSPFVTCCNCFELLQIPRKALLLKTNRMKMQCGSCSTVLLLEVVNKTLLVSVSGSELPSQISNKEAAVGNNLSPSHHTVNEDSSSFSRHMIQEGSLKLFSYDSVHDFQDVDTGKPTTTSSIHALDKTTSSHSSMDDYNGFAEIISLAAKPSPPKGSSLRDYFAYSNIHRKVDQIDKGNEIKPSNMPKEAFLQEDSTEDASLPTEIDVSFQYSISTTSHDSGDSIIEGHQESLLMVNVMINGNNIPDHLVKKAEKRAGPIQPGNYWYDFSAGFWGVTGGPCLGIIPPYIDELNYPLAENCSGGETGVFVNGRQLHSKDFERLCSRGLPRDTNRSYEIEISGKVVDLISGKQLKGLGRLAPSVDKTKCGYGMKPPRK